MEGSIEYNNVWGMCYQDRELAVKVINKRNKAQNPNGKEYM